MFEVILRGVIESLDSDSWETKKGIMDALLDLKMICKVYLGLIYENRILFLDKTSNHSTDHYDKG